ncbi:MAG: type II secretion system protein GspD [Armatimonadetes bacterium]|nr:type II secretion system protein GspD [Armatimonadota bacterium]
MQVRLSRVVSAGLLCCAFVFAVIAPLAASDSSAQLKSESVSVQAGPIIAEPSSTRFAMASGHPEFKEARNISLDFHAADISDVLKALSVQSGTNIVTGNDVKGQITVTLSHTSLSEALDMVTKLSGFKYAKVSPDTYIVGSNPAVNGVLDPASGEVVTEAVSLAFADPDQLTKAIETQVPGLKIAPSGAKPDQPGPRVLVLSGSKSAVDAARTLIAQVEDSLAEEAGGKDVAIYTLRYISATEAVTMLSAVLPRLTVTVGPTSGIKDRPPSGITFVSSSGSGGSGGGSAQSYDAGATAKEEPKTIILSGSPEDVAKAKRILDELDVKPRQVLIEAKVTDISAGDQKKLGITWSWNNIIFDEGTKTNGGGSGNFVRLPITFEGQLDAMLKDNSATLLANPTIAAVEGQPATIFIGDEVKYIIRIEETLTGINFQTETASVGVTLRVIARPDDEGNITLALHPEVSTITEWLTIGTGTGGNNAQTAIALPQIARRFTDHVIRVKDGEMIVIGGLIKDNELSTITKVPLLGDLPFFGGLFRHREKSKQHSEIAIFLKASLMKET